MPFDHRATIIQKGAETNEQNGEKGITYPKVRSQLAAERVQSREVSANFFDAGTRDCNLQLLWLFCLLFGFVEGAGSRMMNALILAAVIVVSGAAGGIATFILDSAASGRGDLGFSSSMRNATSLFGYLIVGVVAAFTVPLLLALAQSSLLQDILSAKDDATFTEACL